MLKKILLLASFFIVFPSHAALINRGNGMIYDDVTNLTWLQDADYAHTVGYKGVVLVDKFGRVSNSVDPYGRMTWNQAKIWASELVYGGYSDWRLPTTMPEHAGFDEKTSELGYMFFVNLGNIAANKNGVYLPGGYGLLNKGPFNMPDGPNFWSSTPQQGSFGESAWIFATSIGFQGATSTDNGSLFNAWAVRDGDVSAVPEPQIYITLLAGLMLMATGRKFKRPD